jgi:hypothetical protein
MQNPKPSHVIGIGARADAAALLELASLEHLQREKAIFEGNQPMENLAPFTARTLKSSQAEQTEQALWSGVRTLQEREMLLRRLATVADATGDTAQAEAGRRQADRVKAQAKLLTRMVERQTNSA